MNSWAPSSSMTMFSVNAVESTSIMLVKFVWTYSWGQSIPRLISEVVKGADIHLRVSTKVQQKISRVPMCVIPPLQLVQQRRMTASQRVQSLK